MNRRTNNALVQTFGVNNLNELTSVSREGTLTVGAPGYGNHLLYRRRKLKGK
ncbi:MAG: hypothetical protein IH623_13955 [Verrucomicrobia bacterium]|nr:hypothetical protein [Verrucomicrobiota bacterium]